MFADTTIKNESIEDMVKEVSLKHIAVIMDGNRRWASKKGLSSIFGHNEGVKALKNTIKAADKFGIKYLTVYAFSTENWGRKSEEVEFLMNLLKATVQKEIKELHEYNIKVKVIGDIGPLRDDLKKVIEEVEDLTSKNSGLSLQIAINYGSRNEITNAVRKIYEEIKTGAIKDPDEITDELISSRLYTAGIPDPDLLIRTGGEQRISNYLLWQSAYTEIYITETFWPDFDENSLAEAVQVFAGRSRRFGRD